MKKIDEIYVSCYFLFFSAGECPIQFYDATIYQDWSSCMKEVINKSVKVL